MKTNYFVLVLIISVLFGCSNGTTTNTAEIKTQTDTVQFIADNIAKAAFEKKLTFKSYTFDITASGEGSLQQLTIQPAGLSIINDKISLECEPVIQAEIADLNNDGFPEVLIYTQAAGSGSYGNVIAYSVNNGKSISSVTFHNIGENPKISQGYMGHDSFSVVNNRLEQSFEIYNENDTNAKPTNGKIRTITYKLVNGNDSRILVVDKVVDVSKN